MGRIFSIAKKDLAEAFRSRTTYFYVFILLIISAQYLVSFNDIVSAAVRRGETLDQIRLAGGSVIDAMVYTLPLIFTMLLCSALVAYSIAMDKAKRTLESLMSTPMSLRQIWLGKSLAVALPGVVIATIVTLLIVMALNFTIAMPRAGGLILPGVLPLVSSLVIIPVMTFVVVALVSFLQLVMTNQRLPNLLFIIIFFAIYFSSVTGAAAGWDFSVIYLMAIVVLAVATIILSRFLNKDRVILSSKS
jgi:ABC-2 type transport system permease protein